jgi:Essential protein Yae1, N terminal
MLRDDDQFPRHTVMDLTQVDEMTELHEQRYANDDFDDVFGSAPPSPTFEQDAHASQESRIRSGNLEPSDIPRLKEKHETEGYRDGVTKGKAESVQKGFDEGYSLGAVLGLRIGKILGLLEGIYNAVKAGGERYKPEEERMEGLWGEAKRELSTQSIFGREWWGEDGVWRFEVPGEKNGQEVLFPDVAGAHPLVVKWENLIEEEVKRWGLDLGILEGDHDEEHMEEEGKNKQDATRINHTAEVTENTEGLAKIMGVAKKELNW